eukprot:RCo017110
MAQLISGRKLSSAPGRCPFRSPGHCPFSSGSSLGPNLNPAPGSPAGWTPSEGIHDVPGMHCPAAFWKTRPVSAPGSVVSSLAPSPDASECESCHRSDPAAPLRRPAMDSVLRHRGKLAGWIASDASEFAASSALDTDVKSSDSLIDPPPACCVSPVIRDHGRVGELSLPRVIVRRLIEQEVRARRDIQLQAQNERRAAFANNESTFRRAQLEAYEDAMRRAMIAVEDMALASIRAHFDEQKLTALRQQALRPPEAPELCFPSVSSASDSDTATDENAQTEAKVFVGRGTQTDSPARFSPPNFDEHFPAPPPGGLFRWYSDSDLLDAVKGNFIRSSESPADLRSNAAVEETERTPDIGNQVIISLPCEAPPSPVGVSRWCSDSDLLDASKGRFLRSFLDAPDGSDASEDSNVPICDELFRMYSDSDLLNAMKGSVICRPGSWVHHGCPAKCLGGNPLREKVSTPHDPRLEILTTQLEASIRRAAEAEDHALQQMEATVQAKWDAFTSHMELAHARLASTDKAEQGLLVREEELGRNDILTQHEHGMNALHSAFNRVVDEQLRKGHWSPRTHRKDSESSVDGTSRGNGLSETGSPVVLPNLSPVFLEEPHTSAELVSSQRQAQLAIIDETEEVVNRVEVIWREAESKMRQFLQLIIPLYLQGWPEHGAHCNLDALFLDDDEIVVNSRGTSGDEGRVTTADGRFPDEVQQIQAIYSRVQELLREGAMLRGGGPGDGG